jgi:hypothetical protein
MQLMVFATEEGVKKYPWSQEQMDAFVGVGIYDTKEYNKSSAKFKNHIYFWYGIKNYQDGKYSQSLLCFETYTYSARDLHDGPVAIGNAALSLGLSRGGGEKRDRAFVYAKVTYKHIIEEFPDNYRAYAGVIMATAMLAQHQDLANQITTAVHLVDKQKNNNSRMVLLRAILPAMIFMNQKKEFAALVGNIGDAELKAYPDLALNYAKGVYTFKIETAYRQADAMLKAHGLEVESVLTKNEILVRPPPGADANPLFRSRAEKIATVVFDINAIGWNDVYDASE